MSYQSSDCGGARLFLWAVGIAAATVRSPAELKFFFLAMSALTWVRSAWA